jgi:hypothetical protein
MASNEFWDCTAWTETKNGKKLGTRIGYANQRDDGGFFVTLVANPVDGKFTIAPRKERKDGEEAPF